MQMTLIFFPFLAGQFYKIQLQLGVHSSRHK